MSTLTLQDDNRAIKERTYKWLLGLIILSIVLFFAALTSYYIVRRGMGNWLQIELPPVFWISTAMILVSSITMNLAVGAVRNDDLKKAKTFLLLTLILGIVFSVCQYFGWTNLYSRKIFFAGSQSNASGSLMYLLTFLHVLHLVAGLIYLGVTRAKIAAKEITQTNMLGIKLCAIYWHFLDALWIYLFLFLLIIR